MQDMDSIRVDCHPFGDLDTRYDRVRSVTCVQVEEVQR